MSDTGPAVTSAASKKATASAWVRPAMKAATIASSASPLATRSALVRKRGSSISSGRPMARNTRSAMPCIEAESAT